MRKKAVKKVEKMFGVGEHMADPFVSTLESNYDDGVDMFIKFVNASRGMDASRRLTIISTDIQEAGNPDWVPLMRLYVEKVEREANGKAD